jgi:hypothetical protein
LLRENSIDYYVLSSQILIASYIILYLILGLSRLYSLLIISIIVLIMFNLHMYVHVNKGYPLFKAYWLVPLSIAILMFMPKNLFEISLILIYVFIAVFLTIIFPQHIKLFKIINTNILLFAVSIVLFILIIGNFSSYAWYLIGPLMETELVYVFIHGKPASYEKYLLPIVIAALSYFNMYTYMYTLLINYVKTYSLIKQRFFSIILFIDYTARIVLGWFVFGV